MRLPAGPSGLPRGGLYARIAGRKGAEQRWLLFTQRVDARSPRPGGVDSSGLLERDRNGVRLTKGERMLALDRFRMLTQLCPGSRRWIAALFLFTTLAVTGCGEPFAIATPRPHYPASASVTAAEKHAWKVLDLRPYREVLYVRHVDPKTLVQPFQGRLLGPLSTLRGQSSTWVEKDEHLFQFMNASFKNLGYFRDVRDYAWLQTHPEAKSVPHFVADYAIDWTGGEEYTFHIRIAEPARKEVVFHVSHYHYRWWPNLDRPLFFPVFNALIDWKNECAAAHPG